MTSRFLIEFIEQDAPILFMPSTIDTKEQVVTVHFGIKKTIATTKKQLKKSSKLKLTTGLAEALNIPLTLQAIHVFTNEERVILGPLLGILTSGFTPSDIQPVGQRSKWFAKLLSEQVEVGALAFVFGEKNIHWDEGLIDGYFYEEGAWKKRVIPFPNAIYNRLPNRKSEQSKQVKQMKQDFEKVYSIPIYNYNFFNKLDIYERLYQEPFIAHYLPETTTFHSFYQLERMLSKYHHLYIKPIHGSLGFGIHQLHYDKQENAYFVRFHEVENKLLKFPTLELLVKHVFPGNKMKEMLIQQGIVLFTYQNKSMDFRVHTNKDQYGEWRVSALAGKVAGCGSPTTHINNGGQIKTLEQLFDDAKLAQHYHAKLTMAALRISKAIESQISKRIAEIGFDFGIDAKGNVWLFEANSKPGRSIFRNQQLKQMEMSTLQLPLSYAVYLTKQQFLKNEGIIL